jgi:hypothetical protein
MTTGTDVWAVVITVAYTSEDIDSIWSTEQGALARVAEINATCSPEQYADATRYVLDNPDA